MVCVLLNWMAPHRKTVPNSMQHLNSIPKTSKASIPIIPDRSSSQDSGPGVASRDLKTV